MPKTLTHFQLGEPVEHRGVVVAPLFPDPRPGLRVPHARRGAPARARDHRDRRGRLRARARVAQPARRQRAALRRRGARRRQAEPHPQRDRARRGADRRPHPRLLRRGGPLVGALGRDSTRPATSRTPTCAAARQRCSPRRRSRAGSRRARCGTRCAPRPQRMGVDSPTERQRRRLRRAPRRAWTSSSRQFPLEPGQCGALLALGDSLCLDWVSRPDAFVAAVAEAPPRLPARRARGARPSRATPATRSPRSSTRSRAARPAQQPSAGLGNDVRLRGERRDRLRARARRRAAPALGVHQRRQGERAFGRIARPSRRR